MHNFDAMFYQNNNIRKTISAGLLIILLFVHGIKLLHTHSYNHSDASSSINKIGKKSDIGNLTTSNDCSICNYQLTKDADDLFHTAYIVAEIYHGCYNFNPGFFYTTSFYTSFDGRGPPTASV